MAVTGLIAECGLHHMGDIEKAKEMAKMARDAGASYAKFQAIGKEKPASGAMPEGFYRQCYLDPLKLLQLQEFGDEVGIPVIFSFFDEVFRHVLRDDVQKIAGYQFRNWALAELSQFNDEDTIVSIPEMTVGEVQARKRAVDKMSIMYVGGYNIEPNFIMIQKLKDIFGRPVGYSCHKQGTDAAERAIRVFGAPLVEVHFNPWGLQKFDGMVYRDCHHAKDLKELERLARLMEKKS